MAAMWQWDVGLAMRIEAVQEELAGAERARNGAWTIRLGGVYLHSKYRPMEEAERWAQERLKDGGEKYVVIVHGFGLGYHVAALFRRLAADALIVVAEPNLRLLKTALELVDHAKMLESGRVVIFTDADRARVVERLEPQSVLFMMGGDDGTTKARRDEGPPVESLPFGSEPLFEPEPQSRRQGRRRVERRSGEGETEPRRHGGTEDRGVEESAVLFAAHPPSLQVAGEFHREFGRIVVEFVAYSRTGYYTLMQNNVTTCRNIANNLGRYVTTPGLELLERAGAGRAAILVAAGPSLAKNMHLLKEVVRGKRRAVIIAVQTMLKPLLAAGIEPDFVTSLDYNTISTRFFENLEEAGPMRKVHLVAEPKAHWNVLDVFGGTMTVLGNAFADKLLRDMAGGGGPPAGLKAGATVAHLSFYLAEYLGCDPIIMVGQDLGFVDGLYYKPGTAIHETWGVELGRFGTLETKEWERIVRSRPILRKIPDIHGQPMYTEEQFFVYLQQFERDFAASRCRVIDATEGGARKQHVRVMTLRGALDEFCRPRPNHEDTKDHEEERRGEETLNAESETLNKASAWKSWRCDCLGRLRGAVGALERRAAECGEMLAVCEEMVPLLEEMIEKQADRRRMSELFIEVDRLRAKVGNDPAMFEMVTHLNTVGELRKLQHEMRIKRAADDMERQRRQLRRDIDYVKHLRIGCERLLEIVDEACGRLEKQAEAVERGMPWPSQVAGGKANG